MATNYTFYLDTEPGAGAATGRQQRRIDNYIFVKTKGFRQQLCNRSQLNPD